MKTIGIIGGMSWESSLEYYRIINEEVKARLGGLHSASLLMHSVDFAPIARMQAREAWDETAAVLMEAASGLEKAGAEMLLIATNTMHRVAEEVQGAVGIPLLHIADVTADAIVGQGMHSVALLGTRFTMEQDFYRSRLEKRGITVLIPEGEDRDTVHRIIYEELVLGEFRDESREAYTAVLERLGDRGAQGAVLGCTEIPLLVPQSASPLPLFDTTRLHCVAAVENSLSA